MILRVSVPTRSDIGLSHSLSSPEIRAWLIEGAQGVLEGWMDTWVGYKKRTGQSPGLERLAIKQIGLQGSSRSNFTLG